MLPIRVIVRTNVDWRGMTWESFAKQKRKFQPEMAILEAKRQLLQDSTTGDERSKHLKAWEKATGRSYFEYRAECKDLCTAQLRKLDCELTIGLENYDFKSSDDEIVIPLDDDDIIYPNVTELRDYFKDESAGVALWNRETDYLGEKLVATPRAYFDTCNYAFRKSYLMQWPEHIAGHVLNNHQAANSYMLQRMGLKEKPLFRRILDDGMPIRMRVGMRQIAGPGVLEIDANYSCYFLHSASISFLLRKMPKNVNSIEYIRSLPLHPLMVE